MIQLGHRHTHSLTITLGDERREKRFLPEGSQLRADPSLLISETLLFLNKVFHLEIVKEGTCWLSLQALRRRKGIY